MKLIIRPRMSGKTTELIKLAADYNGYIVTFDKKSCHRIFAAADGMGIKINMPITWDDFIHYRYDAMGCKRFWMDDLDVMLANMTLCEIAAITMSEASYQI